MGWPDRTAEGGGGMKRIKVVGKHVKDCDAVRLSRSGDWDTCWGPVALQRRYGKHGRVFHTWLRFVCNDTACKAELHVEVNEVFRLLTEAHRKGCE